MLRVAVIGSGPAGVYAAGALVQHGDVAVDVFDRLPCPFGLVRYGVAPDHPKIKSIASALRKVFEEPSVRFLGNVDVGRELTLADLHRHYDAIVFSSGASVDRRLGIPGEDLPGSFSATEFVAWYCGHPDAPVDRFTLDARAVAVIGVGNVALDVTRILAKTADDLRVTDVPDHALRVLDASKVEEAFKAAPHVVSLDLVSQRLVPSAMEPRSTIAEIEKKTGRLLLHVQSQTPASTRDVLADAVLKRPKESIRVLVGDIGGGFGQKTSLYPEDGIVAYAAVKLGRKVRWRGDRTDEFVGGTHGRDLTSTGEFALDAKGRVQAYRVRSVGGTGAYLSGTGAIIPLVLGPFVQSGVYDLPLVHYEIKAVMTNTAPVGAYRGAGRPEGVFIVERLMDAAARQIGMDPRAIRKVNYIKPAQLPYTNAVGQVYDSGAFAHMLERASKLADWDGFAARKKAAKKKGLLYGRGLTSYIEWTGGRAHTEKVSLHATAEGRIILHSGTQAMGQGLQTTYSQMVAASLGISIDQIDVVQGDTDLATGFGSVGSRSLFVGGTAVAVSTNDLIAKAREKASNLLEAAVEDIEYRDGWLTVVGTDKRIGLFEIARKETGARLSVDSEGEVDGPSWPNGTHICEVEIDPETGVSKVVRYTTVDDVGVAVNPMLVTGQVHGGVAQGIGQALYEGVSYDAEGQLLTASYQDYCVPRADDIPPIEVTLDDSAPCRTNPLGAKGCGESGAIGGPPCIANGVMDALSELGIKTLNTPLSPLKVWQAIREAKAARV